MKIILAFILITIVAVAVFEPCCMVDNCQEELVLSKQETPNKSNAEGTCSPFFACATCHGFISMVEPVIAPVPEVVHSKYYISYLGYTSTVYAVSLWQPPRLT